MQTQAIQQENQPSAIEAFMKGRMAPKVALALFLFAKLCTICAVPCIFTYIQVGIALTIGAATFAVSSICVCAYDIYQQNKEERQNKDQETLRRLLKTGQLEALLAEVRSHGSR